MILTIVIAIIAGMYGGIAGSFLITVYERRRTHQSIVFPASHCFACGHKLNWLCLIPVVSYLALGGKCHWCKEPIPRKYFWGELSGVVIGVVLALALV